MRRILNLTLLMLSTSVFADMLEPLSFGTIVVARNDRISSVKMPTNGAMSSTNDIHIMDRGHPARLYIEDLPANTLINFSSSSLNVKLTRVEPAPPFTLTQLLFKPAKQSNVYGEIELVIGAIIQTSGTGDVYTDGDYQGTVSIELSF